MGGKVTVLMMDVITDKSNHNVTPMAVSVCTTPAAPSPLPLPYPVIANSSEGITDACLRTKASGAALATVGSVLKSCHGNEPGTLKEVVSLNTGGPVFITMGAPVVLAELGMTGITGSLCMSNKQVTVGAPGTASGAGGAGGGSGAGGSGGGAGGDAGSPQGPAGGGGSAAGGSNAGASAGTSSAAPGEHQCQDGHPVDVVTGNVVDAAVDLRLTGLIPVEWKRTYSSERAGDLGASLGPGWAHGFEQRVSVDAELITLRDGEGRDIWFEKIAVGQSTFHRRERMTLHREGENAFKVELHARRQTMIFRELEANAPAVLTRIVDAWENTVAITYQQGRLDRIIDTAGREIRATWSGNRITRLVVAVRGATEQWVDYTYDEKGCLAIVTDCVDASESYVYDDENRMVMTTMKSGVSFEYTYDESGRCDHTWGPDGLWDVELAYDDENKLTKVFGEQSRIVHWGPFGRAVKETTLDGTLIEEAAYDEDGHRIALVNGAGEGTKTWFDARGNKVREVDATGAATVWEYDARDLPTKRTEADGNVTTYAHDAKGGLVHVKEPTGKQWFHSSDGKGRIIAVADEAGPFRSFEYDADSNVVTETDSRGNKTRFSYDALGRSTAMSDGLERSWQLMRDKLGRPLVLTLPNGTTVQRSFDGLGRVVREVAPDGAVTQMQWYGLRSISRIQQADGRTYDFTYTATERLATVQNPLGEVYTFGYDEAGRIIEEKAFDEREITYERDASGRVSRTVYADGSWRRFEYDRVGRVVAEDASDASVVAFRRDAMGRIVDAALAFDGRKEHTLFERDALGRVITERQGDATLRFQFDAERRTSRQLPNGHVTHYFYDREGAVTALDHAGRRVEFQRDVAGRETGRTDGKITTASRYDALDRLIEQRTMGPVPADGVPNVLAQRQWAYDAAGRVTRIDDAGWGATTYRYDRTGNLVEAVSGELRESFAYDAAGSLVRSLEGLRGTGEKSSWKLTAGNRLAESERAKYAYDDRGRRVGKLEKKTEKKTIYRWDVRDQLIEVELPDGTRVENQYDAIGRRLRKIVHRKDNPNPRVVGFVWDGDVIAADVRPERGARTFAHLPSTLVPVLQAEGKEVFVVVHDHLGMPKELIDQNARVVWRAKHSAWGTLLETKRHEFADRDRGYEVSSPFRLLGQYADDETGLCVTRYRFFDAEVGRWLSPDPMGLPGGRNLFRFDGSPTVQVDPMGLSTTGSGHTPAITPGTNPEMARQAIQNTQAHEGTAAEKADFFEGQAAQVTALSGNSWTAARSAGGDGSHIFAGTVGHAVVIAPDGSMHRGNLSTPGQFGFGPGGQLTPNYGALTPL